jgi:hypothetical protein
MIGLPKAWPGVMLEIVSAIGTRISDKESTGVPTQSAQNVVSW